MKCPDCGETLTQISISGSDQSYRCFKCGGFWVDGWVVNRLNASMLAKWMKVVVDSGWLNLGDNSCPVDSTKLVRFRGESVPTNMVVKRCERCGRWWFPTDTLLEFKPAQEAKVNYFKLWGMITDVSALLLPALGVVIVLVGVVVGGRVVQERQQAAIEAASLVQGFGTTDLGNGNVMVVFYSPAVISEVEYKKESDVEWKKVEARFENKVYTVRLSGIEEGGEYVVRILGKEFGFVAK